MGSKSDRLIRDLTRFRRKISKRCRIEEMILFGSRARGRAHKDSDIDLIIVSDSFKGKGILERAPPLYLEWDLVLPVDFICYTKKEFRELASQVSIVSEALKEGVRIPP